MYTSWSKAFNKIIIASDLANTTTIIKSMSQTVVDFSSVIFITNSLFRL